MRAWEKPPSLGNLRGQSGQNFEAHGSRLAGIFGERKMIDPRTYAVRVQFVEDGADSYFEATVDELPGVAAFETSHKRAYDTVIEAIEALQALAAEDGRPFPQPVRWSEAEASGRITLRMPRSLHRSLEIQARHEDVSLNQHLVAILASGSAVAYAKEAIGEKMRSVMMPAIINTPVPGDVFSPVIWHEVMNLNQTVYAAASSPSVGLDMHVGQRLLSEIEEGSAVRGYVYANPGIAKLC